MSDASHETNQQAADHSSNHSGDVQQPLVRPENPEVYDLKRVNENRGNVHTQEEKDQAWSGAASMVQTYSDEMIQRWKEEIDTYLVFAGLFSAILTTFNVQTYVLLTPTPPDPSITILQQISSQLASFSIHHPFVNSTQQPGTLHAANSDTSVAVPRWAIWLNGLWFSGLILSLAAATIGIMAKQWLNEYKSGILGTTLPAARLRQVRLYNFREWHVEDIVGIIPVLLQLALALFLTGLLVLLWTLHSTIAAISSVLVGLLGTFVGATTLLPLFMRGCAYVTPQARALHTFLRLLGDYCTKGYRRSHWSQQDLERLFVGSSHSYAAVLNQQILLEGYSLTLGENALSLATVCILDFKEHEVVNYFRKFHAYASTYFGPSAEPFPGRANHQRLLWLQVILCVLLDSDRTVLSDEAEYALNIYYRRGRWSPDMKAADVEWALSAIDAISRELWVPSCRRRLSFLNEEWVADGRSSLLDFARKLKVGKDKVFLRAMLGSYQEVRFTETRIPVDGLATHLRHTYTFLRCANKILEASGDDPNLLETVRTYTGDVLAQLASTLLKEFRGDQGRHFPQGTNADVLCNVMMLLAGATVSDDLLRCIDVRRVPDVLNMVDTLRETHDYGNDGIKKTMPGIALELKEKVIRLKGDPRQITAVATTPSTSRLFILRVRDTLSRRLRMPSPSL